MSEMINNQSEKPTSPTIDRLMDPRRNTYTEQLIIAKLKLNYSQPHRKHHTFEHVTQFVTFLDENSAELSNRRVANWAALYHDAVFDPMAEPGENEIASAKMAIKNLSGIMYANEIDQVERFIIATADHIADPDDHDMQLFMDADLSILGSPPDEYKKYAANIRLEYDHLSNRDYARPRAEFLISLLRRERIYMTDTAYNALESRAKQNIIAELDYLGY